MTTERVPAIPLPDLATTDTAHRLARQLRSASMHGHCDVAWIMWRDLEKLPQSVVRADRRRGAPRALRYEPGSRGHESNARRIAAEAAPVC